MQKLITASVVLGGLSAAAFLMALDGWIRAEESLPRRLWKNYVAWQQELSGYLLDRMTPKQFAARHAMYAGVAFAVGLGLALTVAHELLLFLGIFAAGIVWPIIEYKQQVEKRREQLMQQIDPALQLIANALQVAPNLDEALRLGSEHLQPPMSAELNRVTTAYRLGRTLDDALQEMAERCHDPFVTSMVTALIVGRRTGGNISATLRRIAYSTREAVRVELELKAKTKGQRNQFYLVVGLYPLGLLGLKAGVPAAWNALTVSYQGKVALFGSMGVVAMAVAWAQHILSPKNL